MKNSRKAPALLQLCVAAALVAACDDATDLTVPSNGDEAADASSSPKGGSEASEGPDSPDSPDQPESMGGFESPDSPENMGGFESPDSPENMGGAASPDSPDSPENTGGSEVPDSPDSPDEPQNDGGTQAPPDDPSDDPPLDPNDETPAEASAPGGSRDPDAPAYIDDQNCLHLDNPAHSGITICGRWSFDRESGSFEADGDLSVQTPVGDFPLLDASLRASRSPLALVGQAAVPFPSIGFLADAGVESDAPRATIALAPGAELPEIEINGEVFEADPNDYYLVFDYNIGLEASFGTMSVSTPGSGSTLVVAPEEPLIYVGGDLAGLLTGGMIEDAAFGFSLDGRIPYSPSHELYDTDGWREMSLSAQIFAQGAVQIPNLPISLAARLMINADADGDGQTIFAGDERDLVLGADGEIDLGYTKAGFDLTLMIGEGSLVYDAREGEFGAAWFYATNAPEIFEGTALEFLEVAPAGMEIYGYFREVDDALIRVDAHTLQVLGYSLASGSVELRTDGVRMHAQVGPFDNAVLGHAGIEVDGSVESDGDFSLTGSANLTVADYTLANAHITMSNSGLAATGRISIPGVGECDMNGSIGTNGAAVLTGRADLSPAGLRLAGATVSLSDAGLFIEGDVDLPQVGQVHVFGQVLANGQFELQGSADLSPAGIILANAAVRVTHDGATISGLVSVPNFVEVYVIGSVTAQSFSLEGRADLQMMDLHVASARISLNPAGLSASGTVNLPGMGRAQVSGQIAPEGFAVLTGTADLSPAGFDMAGASVTVDSRSGGFVQGGVNLAGLGGCGVAGGAPANAQFLLVGRCNLSPLGYTLSNAEVQIRPNGAFISGGVNIGGTGFNVAGEARSDGYFRLEGSVGVNVGIANGRVTAVLGSGGAELRFDGALCVSYPSGVSIPNDCGQVCYPNPTWNNPLRVSCDNVCTPAPWRASLSYSDYCQDTHQAIGTDGNICLDYGWLIPGIVHDHFDVATSACVDLL